MDRNLKWPHIIQYDPSKFEPKSDDLDTLKTIERNKIYGPAETKLIKNLRVAVERGDKRKAKQALKEIERKAPTLTYLLGPPLIREIQGSRAGTIASAIDAEITAEHLKEAYVHIGRAVKSAKRVDSTKGTKALKALLRDAGEATYVYQDIAGDKRSLPFTAEVQQVATQLRRTGQPELARRLVRAAGAAFVVEIKVRPPRYIYGPDRERITDKDMINLLRSYFLSEKKLKNRMAIMDFSTKGKWPAIYIDSADDSEQAASTAEDEVMRLLHEAANRYPELEQWVDDIRDSDLELGIL